MYCKPPFASADKVISYLGRYTHRVAISNNRILNMQDGSVTFRWRDYADGNKMKIMTVTAEEFIRRFLLHILPCGFRKIRHYGIFSFRNKSARMALCRRLTNTPMPLTTVPILDRLRRILGTDFNLCPCCKRGFLSRDSPSSFAMFPVAQWLCLLHYKVIFHLSTPITSDVGRGNCCSLTSIQIFFAARFGIMPPLLFFLISFQLYSNPIAFVPHDAALFKRIIRNRPSSVLSGLFLYAIPDNSLFFIPKIKLSRILSCNADFFLGLEEKIRDNILSFSSALFIFSVKAEWTFGIKCVARKKDFPDNRHSGMTSPTTIREANAMQEKGLTINELIVHVQEAMREGGYSISAAYAKYGHWFNVISTYYRMTGRF